MPALITLVEGEGDEDAIPSLLMKILYDLEQWSWYVGDTVIVQNLGKLKKGLAKYLNHAVNKKNCGAVLILLDMDDGCPVDIAQSLAKAIRKFNLPKPVAIVFAHREYEAWFLASLPTIAGHYGLPPNLIYEGDVEAKRGVKEWLSNQMPSHLKYKERVHQKQFTSLINIELAYENSRSFRRLYDAVAELLEAFDAGERGVVTPRKGIQVAPA